MSGNHFPAEIQEKVDYLRDICEIVKHYTNRGERPPCLAVILVSDDESTINIVKEIRNQASVVGITIKLYLFEDNGRVHVFTNSDAPQRMGLYLQRNLENVKAQIRIINRKSDIDAICIPANDPNSAQFLDSACCSLAASAISAIAPDKNPNCHDFCVDVMPATIPTLLRTTCHLYERKYAAALAPMLFSSSSATTTTVAASSENTDTRAHSDEQEPYQSTHSARHEMS